MPRPLSIRLAVRRSLRSAELLPRDDGGRALAIRYATAIDDGGNLAVLGPKLLAVLESLGMTPAGRGVKGGAGRENIGGKLDELRQRRAARAREH